MDNWITKMKWEKAQCYDVKHYYRNIYEKKDLGIRIVIHVKMDTKYYLIKLIFAECSVFILFYYWAIFGLHFSKPKLESRSVGVASTLNVESEIL